MIYFAVLFTLLLGVCVFLGLPSVRKWQRITSVVTFFLLAGVVYAGSVDLMGTPKPMKLEWRPPGKATVLAARMHEGEAIYVWLQTPDAKAPRAYALPWNTQTAQQLQSALQEREARGSPVKMTLAPPDGGEDGVAKFYAQPQQALPDKDHLDGAGVVYRHPDARP